MLKGFIFNKLPILLALTLTWAQGMAGNAGATDSGDAAPQQIDGAKRVDAELLLDLYSHLSGLLIIDARNSADRKNGFIESSISLPSIETDCEALAAWLS